MIPSIIINAFSLLLVHIILYVIRYYYHYFTRQNPLPGPFPLPILGNIHQKRGLEYNDWLMLMHKKYGDIFEINMAGKRTIVLCSIDLIENMNITSEKTKYPFRNIQFEGAIEYKLQGLASNNNQKSWKYKRQLYTQALMSPSFNNQVFEWINELWNEMETCWNSLEEDCELDLIKWMNRFTNEIIFRISTGKKNDAVIFHYKKIALEYNAFYEKEREKIEESENFIQSIDTFVKGIIYFYDFNKFMRHYVPFIREKVKSLLKNRDYLYDKIYDIIKKRRIEIENTPLDQPLRHDLLTSHITANVAHDINSVKHVDADLDLLRPMADTEIFGSMIDFITAGTSNVANMFCFIVYYLGHYPMVKQRFRKELNTVLKTKFITYNDLDKLQYCDAIINEVYRHCPVFSSINRVNVEKDVIRGFDWPEGTSFSIFYYAIMRRKDYWTDPEKFDPDRFYKIEEKGKYLLEKQYVKKSFTMFGGGIRTCPARKLAMMELKYLLASIYRKYDLELADMDSLLKYNSTLITTCKELIVKITPRDVSYKY